MYRAAVVFESSPFDRKGMFNAIHERIKHLSDVSGYKIDVFCIHSRDNAFTRRVRHTVQVPDVECIDVEGIRYDILWYKFSICDHILLNKLHKEPFFFNKFIKNNTDRFKDYDIMIAHSYTGGLLADSVFRKHSVPYCVTWHGSDVHTHPWKNPLVLGHTRNVMEHASFNFYVSEALLRCSQKISGNAISDILYNGISDRFVRYDDSKRQELRRTYGVASDDKVVAFVGNLHTVKNAELLVPIFAQMQSTYEGKLHFWVVGDGKLRKSIEESLASDKSGMKVRMWGNQPAGLMPDLMNCMDLLVLPSKNEGLPLVCLEALKCGAKVVGSNVGGIPEVIGDDNVADPGIDFIERISQKAVSMLASDYTQPVPDKFSWHKAALKEMEAIDSILKSK